ncbi:hypothetical protein [Actinomadura fibrosa]|uniref:PH domain-containing protein n=1 Tax=Actinomadura fibrosa TaxID=111802 RepID=A0ABW2XWS0_9ACTN|nr:hypothetical protein [Actinomadura fibrosa]
MPVIREVRATPGGRVRLDVASQGYSADAESFGDKLERWGHRLFRDRILFSALGLAIVLSFPGYYIPKAMDASEATMMIFVAPALLCFVYFLVGLALRAAASLVVTVLMVVSLPLLLIGPYRRWLFGTRSPIERRRGFVHTSQIHAGRIQAEGDRVVVWVQLTSGMHVSYTAHGDAGRRLAQQFAALLGPHRLQPTH